jgi:hypothetical protein
MICPFCETAFPAVSETGRPRRFCSDAHRKAAWREVDRCENELRDIAYQRALEAQRRNLVMLASLANREDALRARIVALRGTG